MKEVEVDSERREQFLPSKFLKISTLLEKHDLLRLRIFVNHLLPPFFNGAHSVPIVWLNIMKAKPLLQG
jgi:hypothetical protein